MIKVLCWLCDAVHFLYTTAMEGCETGGDMIRLGFQEDHASYRMNKLKGSSAVFGKPVRRLSE